TVRQDLKALIRQLDVAQGDMGGIDVVRLNYAQAEPMKVLLEGLLKSSLFSRKVLGEGKDVESAYRIEADTANNALVIAAESGVSADILKVVRQLDVPRKQVLIEAIVAEISEDQAKVLSAQLAVAGREGGAIINFNDLLPALIGLGLDDDIEAGD